MATESLQEKILSLTINLVNSEFKGAEKKEVFSALNILLQNQIDIYKFDSKALDAKEISFIDYQNTLATLNEKESRRKKEGVYYTDEDITSYLITNALLNFAVPQNNQVFSTTKCVKKLVELDNKTFEKTILSSIFDPTCGTGQFIIPTARIKYQLMLLAKGKNKIKDEDVLAVASNIYGNDIEKNSIDITKLRLFFELITKLHETVSYKKLARIISKNFFNDDFVNIQKGAKFPKTDIFVGNPPYVEYRFLKEKPTTEFGNAYADVLLNSSRLLNNNGVMAFIIPISYVSTPRMRKIRELMKKSLGSMFVLNFADRPDCLFHGVHQKLTLFISKKNNVNHIYSSIYYYWYKSERKDLLDKCKVFYSGINKESYIPKIGNKIEKGIFKKITENKGNSLINYINARNTNSTIYLNMRGCFWMKAFTFNPGSKEYKALNIDSKWRDYILALLNSDLFFLYWIIISDCWHITKKELSEFKVVLPHDSQLKQFSDLIKDLEDKLEKTKKYIGSKQVEYEYKHRECKDIIEKIDDALKPIYRLTESQIEYLKNYQLKYRMSDGE